MSPSDADSAKLKYKLTDVIEIYSNSSEASDQDQLEHSEVDESAPSPPIVTRKLIDLSLLKQKFDDTVIFNMAITSFSKIKKTHTNGFCITSHEFKCGGFSWFILIY